MATLHSSEVRSTSATLASEHRLLTCRTPHCEQSTQARGPPPNRLPCRRNSPSYACGYRRCSGNVSSFDTKAKPARTTSSSAKPRYQLVVPSPARPRAPQSNDDSARIERKSEARPLLTLALRQVWASSKRKAMSRPCKTILGCCRIL